MDYKKNILFKKTMFLIMGIVLFHDIILSSSSDISFLDLDEDLISPEVYYGEKLESKVDPQEVESTVNVKKSKEVHKYWGLEKRKKKITPALSKSQQKAYYRILEKLSRFPRYDVNSAEYDNFKSYTHKLVSKLRREEKILKLVHPVSNKLDFELVFKKIKSYKFPQEYINKIDNFEEKSKKEFAKVLDLIVFL